RVPRRERAGDTAVLHPRYPIIPRLSTLVHPLLLQAGAEADVRRLRPGAMLIDAHFLYPDGIAAICIGRRLGLPVVLTARGSDVNVLAQQPGPRAWLRRALPRAAAVVAVSRELAHRLAESTGLPTSRIEVIPNGVDRSLFRPGDQ